VVNGGSTAGAAGNLRSSLAPGVAGVLLVAAHLRRNGAAALIGGAGSTEALRHP
jgi:hypothetical protein